MRLARLPRPRIRPLPGNASGRSLADVRPRLSDRAAVDLEDPRGTEGPSSGRPRPGGRRAKLACLGVLGALFGPACRGCADEASRPYGERRVLVLGTTQEPATLDPAFAVRSGEQEIVRLLYPDLTVFDDTGRVVPRLSDTLPQVETSSRSGRVARWRLREGLQWSDGVPLTSADVVFGHAVEGDPSLEAINQPVAEQVERIVPEDDRRFSVHWRTGYRGVAEPRVHAILPRHAYPTERGPGFQGVGRSPGASSGPYRLAAWRPGEYLALEPNPYWPGPTPWLERIVFRFFPSEDAFETELLSGGIHALGPSSGLSLDNALRLAERLRETHKLVSRPSGLLLHLSLRLDHPLLANPLVRRALDLAIDRDRMAELVYGGLAVPAAGLFGPNHPAHRAARRASHDPMKARALLAETGRASAPLTLTFASGSEAGERAATYLKAAFEAIGLEIDLRALPLRVLFGGLEAREQAPLTLFAWRTRPDWAGSAMLRSGGRQNYGGYASDEVDALLDAASETLETDRWAEILWAIEDRVLTDRPLLPLVFRDEVSLRPRGLENWRPTGTTTPITWNAETWRWLPDEAPAEETAARTEGGG